MIHLAALRAALLGALAVLLTAGPASAWIETAVRSHGTSIRVEADGMAEVRHELVLRIRGSKMTALELAGVGESLELLPDATVRRARQGSASLWPLALSSTEAGDLRLTIQSDRGIGGGTYLFEFGYKLNLVERGLIQALGADYRIQFVGPRLSTGVDSAKLVFRVPRGSLKPRLDDAEDAPSAGVLLGQIRRGAEEDEVELVRAYVAQREPAVWAIIVPRDALPGVQLDGPLQFEQKHLVVAKRKLAEGFLPLPQLLVLFAMSLAFGLLTFACGRIAVRRAARADAQLKPFLPGGPLLRASVASLAVGGSGCLVLLHRPGWSVLPAIVALAAATHLLPVRRSRARGPGRWEPLKSGAPRGADVPGEAWFELGTVRGFGLFSAILLGVLYGAYRLLPVDNYLAMMSIIYGVMFLPLFLTGRRADLPRQPLEQAAPVLAWLERTLDPARVSLELWGRAAIGESASKALDEVRIRVLLASAPKGLRALEVAFDEGPGAFVMPCLVVRVLDGSDAQATLPQDIPWTRGRDAEERVAVLRPTAPNTSQLLRLLRSVIQNLQGAGPRRASHRPRRSSGSGLSTMKVAPERSVPAT